MSQFTPRFQSSSSQSQRRDSDVKLRASSEAYTKEAADSVYSRRNQDTQKIKNLSFWENTDSDAVDEDEWTERQSATPFILIMIILVVASTLLWFMFQWATGENTNTPPIIPADTTPFKVRPNNPGGMMIPHQDKLVYGRLSQDASQPIERLLPPPEQPMAHAPMTHPPYQPPYAQGQGYPSANPPPPAGYTPDLPPQGAPQPAAPQYAPPPQPYPPFQHPQQQPPVQGHMPYPASQGQFPYGTQAPMPPAILPTMPATPPQSTSPYPESSKTSTVEDIKPASDEDDADDTAIQDGQKELDQLIAREAEKPLKQSTKKNSAKFPKSTATGLGKHKVQIASLPSKAMAENEIKRLRDHHGPFFDNKPWNIQKINLGPDRGVTHRLVVGAFPNHNAATKFCKRLRAEKIGCLVIAPANE
jgi:hypothetical protein